MIVEPRFWVESTGSQHLWSNHTGAPTAQTMPAYTTANLSLQRSHHLPWEKQSVNLRVDMMNIGKLAVQRIRVHLQRRLFCGAGPGSKQHPQRIHQRVSGRPALDLRHDLVSVLIVLPIAQSGQFDRSGLTFRLCRGCLPSLRFIGQRSSAIFVRRPCASNGEFT